MGLVGWDGREVVVQRGLEESHVSTSVCTLCMGQHAGPHTQGPQLCIQSQMPTGAWMEVKKMGWATCS